MDMYGYETNSGPSTPLSDIPWVDWLFHVIVYIFAVSPVFLGLLLLKVIDYYGLAEEDDIEAHLMQQYQEPIAGYHVLLRNDEDGHY